jgi:hypothetical protein
MVRSYFVRALSIAIVLLALEGALAQSSAQPPGSFEESIEVRLLPVEVIVLDPRQDDRPVSGLQKEQFRVQIGGRPLVGHEFQRLRFEEVCRSEQQPTPTIVIADLNFLDNMGRAAVADELERLADRISSLESIYKVYVITRQTHRLTDGFTRDPREIKRAARSIRETVWLNRDGTPSIEPNPTERIARSELKEGERVLSRATVQALQGEYASRANEYFRLVSAGCSG